MATRLNQNLHVLQSEVVSQISLWPSACFRKAFRSAEDCRVVEVVVFFV
jgi:hypothetical protein